MGVVSIFCSGLAAPVQLGVLLGCAVDLLVQTRMWCPTDGRELSLNFSQSVWRARESNVLVARQNTATVFQAVCKDSSQKQLRWGYVSPRAGRYLPRGVH